jgi:Lon protease-like protein
VTTVRLPLFPLNSVLFPGLVLPLNVFEERYRAMMRDLLKTPEDESRRFAVVAIRDGHEVSPSAPGMPDGTAVPDRGPTAGFGDDPLAAFHEVGCVADAATIRERADGSFEVLATGTTRVRLLSVDASGAFLTAELEELPEDPGDEAGALAEGVLRAVDRRGPAGRTGRRLLSRRRRRDAGRPGQTAAAPGPRHGLPAARGTEGAARRDGHHP